MNYRMNKRIKRRKIEYFSSKECDELSHELKDKDKKDRTFF